MKRAIVFDGNSLLNRAFYGVRPLSNSKGLPTNAVFGFVNILRRALEHPEASGEGAVYERAGYDYAAIAFDVKAPTFRHLACDFYKANRKPMPEELRLQLPYAKEAAKALGLCVLEKPGFEADDLLGTLSRVFSEQGVECWLTTGDRDSYQLITDAVRVRYVSTNDTRVIDVPGIRELYGLRPEQLIDVKALMGDASDNIPGVPKVGEKSALKLISQYGDLEGVYAHLDEQKGALLTNLKENKELAYVSRFLAEIRLDVPVEKELSAYKYRGADIPALKKLYAELEFRKLLEQLDKPEPSDRGKPTGSEKSSAPEKKPSPEPSASTREKPSHPDYLPPDGMERRLREGVPLSMAAAPEGVKVYDGGHALLLSYGEAAEAAERAPSVRYWALKETLAAFREKGVALPVGNAADLSLMAYLAALSDSVVTYEGTAFRAVGEISGCEPDPALFGLLEDFLQPRLTEAQKKLYADVELPLTLVLADMEARGFLLDLDTLNALGNGFLAELAELESAIYALAGHPFNINSPAQLGTLLFEERGLKHGKKTKSGKYSTDVEILEQLADEDPLVGMILEYRKLAKLQSTYIEGLRKEVSADGRVHTTFRQTLTMTGRLSSAEPNLQNIPVRTERGRALRRLFVAAPGCVLIDADYSQIELRLMAHVSGDEALQNAFLSGADIHRSTAAGVFGVPSDSVTDEMRKFAKTINFGILYGMGDYSLSKDLGIPLWRAKEYIASYFAKHPGIRAYLDGVKEFAAENGYVETMYGRRREISGMTQQNRVRRAAAERIAMNTPIQGAAADLIKIAMVNVDRALREAGLEARLILQIHDELIVEAPESEAQAAKEILVREMTSAAKLSVPLLVDVGVGPSWADAK